MEIIKYYKNYAKLKKDLYEKVGIYSAKTIKIRCYTSIDDNVLATDLEAEIFSHDDTFEDSITIASIETKSEENWNEITEQHRRLLLPEKQKLFKYLKDNFPNVLSANDYSF